MAGGRRSLGSAPDCPWLPRVRACRQAPPPPETSMTHPIDGYGNAPRIAPPPPPPPPPPPEPEPVPEHVNEQSRKAVDETIGPDATAEQRTQAYEEAQQHYDMISSGGDFTGVSDAEMQLAAISRMEENGIPTRFDPEVVAADSEHVKPDTDP